MLVSRSCYYLQSVVTLLRGFHHPLRLIAIFLGLSFSAPLVVSLRNGLRFAVRTAMDIWILKEVCLDAVYERHGLRLQPSWTVVDIGGGLGEFAIHAARQCYHGHIYAFEPAPESFALLQANALHNAIGNLTAFPHAVGAVAGQLSLDTTSGVPVLYRATTAADGQPGSGVAVPSVTIEQVFATTGIARCDMLKLDCEGSEYEILFSTPPGILANIIRICLEYHNGVTPYTHHHLIDWLRRQGYIVHHDPNPVHSYTGLLYAIREGER